MRNRSPILYTLLVILAGYFRWKKTYFADKNIFLLFSIISRGYRKGILAWNGLVMVFIMSVRIMKGLREWFGLFKWMQVFKNRPSKISGRQPLKKVSCLRKSTLCFSVIVWPELKNEFDQLVPLPCQTTFR